MEDGRKDKANADEDWTFQIDGAHSLVYGVLVGEAEEHDVGV